MYNKNKEYKVIKCIRYSIISHDSLCHGDVNIYALIRAFIFVIRVNNNHKIIISSRSCYN